MTGISSTFYNLTLRELLEDEPEDVSLPEVTGLDDLDAYTKVQLIMTMYLKPAKIRKNRKGILFCLFLIGKEIFTCRLREKETGLTQHYYKVAKRIFLIFENRPEQIMRTKNLTISIVHKLSEEEVMDLSVVM